MIWWAQAIIGAIIGVMGIGLSQGNHFVLGIILALVGGLIFGRGLAGRSK